VDLMSLDPNLVLVLSWLHAHNVREPAGFNIFTTPQKFRLFPSSAFVHFGFCERGLAIWSWEMI
jgi:hypothetical protein